MRFTKLQGLGNDFVLIDGRLFESNWAELAVALCRPHYGVGGDGLLVLEESQNADYKMRIYNPDGSEAEACGNGLRCMVRYIASEIACQKRSFRIETLAGIRSAEVLDNGGISNIRVGMGLPEFHAAAIPVILEDGKGRMIDIMLGDYPLDVASERLKLSFISMGNPHAVCFCETPVADFILEKIGPLVEKHPIFPRGVNFEVAHILGRNQISMRVWERGAGETLACGSGACAVAIAARLHGLCDDNCEVIIPGGSAYIQWSKGKEAFLSGPAEIVFRGEWLAEYGMQE